jgi:hypothetical protein
VNSKRLLCAKVPSICELDHVNPKILRFALCSKTDHHIFGTEYPHTKMNSSEVNGETIRRAFTFSGVDAGQSHQFGLHSLRERLRAAYGSSGDLRVHSGPEGFEATFMIASSSESSLVDRGRVGESV